MRRISAVFLCVLAVAACRGDDDGDDNNDTVNPDAPGGEMTVQDVQNDATPIATPVTLRGVVVTAIDNYGPRKGNFYVAEPGGGERSGVLVFGAPLEQVSDLTVGDLVDITNAEKDEFSLETDDRTVTELVPITGGEMTVAVTGTGEVPAPAVLDALTIGQMETTAREDEYEKWEGTLVTVNNVSVTSELRPVSSSNPDPMFVAFSITGVLEVDSSLAEIPYTEGAPDPFVTGGDCLMSITGMGDYFFNYKVLPRSTDAIMLNGTGCPAAEAVGTCTDGIDNDANGFTDCDDRGCRTEPTCVTDTTVVMIQNGSITDGQLVTLADVVVTAIGRGPNIANVWVADSLTAAPHNSVQVFRGGNAGALPTGVVVGAHVSIAGEVDEFNSGGGTGTLTEVRNPTITLVAPPSGLPTPATGLSIATLTDDTTGEPYEGVLVDLNNVRVIANPMMFGVRHFGMMGSSVVQFESDDDIRAVLAEADGTCYSLIRGVWSYQVFDDRWAILPLGGATDVVVAPNQGDCP